MLHVLCRVIHYIKKKFESFNNKYRFYLNHKYVVSQVIINAEIVRLTFECSVIVGMAAVNP